MLNLAVDDPNDILKKENEELKLQVKELEEKLKIIKDRNFSPKSTRKDDKDEDGGGSGQADKRKKSDQDNDKSTLKDKSREGGETSQVLKLINCVLFISGF
ncbi:MAG: hypothetical protein L7S42_01640 [Flavobacteriaceae bacterium]|nr:hypothetical protein [Flavobacteriaceae bacterium]